MYKYNGEVVRRLEKLYGDPLPELVFSSEFELLVAVILSAQCTDKRVNIVTDKLFQSAKTPEQFAAMDPAELERCIRSCGLANTKSRNIVAMAQMLLDQYDGKVPPSIEELQKLPGVGRKTANVVGSVAFKIPAIAVDTHVQRVSNRIGMAHSKNVEGTERQLNAAIPKEKWRMAHHWLIFHGRRVCTARNPKCGECVLADICLSSIKGNTKDNVS